MSVSVRELPLDSVIIGCAPIAGCMRVQGQKEAIEALVACMENGFFHFDTAPHYGLGLSEERLGEAVETYLASHPEHADRVTIWTKIGRVIKPSGTETPEDVIEETNTPGHPENIFPETPSGRVQVLDYSKTGVQQAYQGSLTRMRTKSLYGLRVHDLDTEQRFQSFVDPSTGGVAQLVAMREAGKIQDVSAGLNYADWLLRLIRACPDGTFDSVLVAGAWNLLEFTALELLQECEKRNIRVHNAGIYCSGLLVGGSSFRYVPASEELKQKTKQWEALVARHNLSLPTVAMAFAWLPVCVEKLVIGIKSPQEVQWTKESAAAVHSVPAALWKEARESGLIPDFVPLPI